MDNKTFSTTLQKLRKEKKVTQEQLATHLGVSAQAVSKWENGSYPEGDLLPQIADFFEVSIDYLYGRGSGDKSFEQMVFEKVRETSSKEFEETKRFDKHYDLVKLNLRNEEVIQHIFGAVEGWINEFDIDGIRLDVAYCLDRDFLRRLREFTDSRKQDFFLVGEVLHGEYGRMLNEMNIHSVTNYQCYKGIHSAVNSMNMFEIIHQANEKCIARAEHIETK